MALTDGAAPRARAGQDASSLTVIIAAGAVVLALSFGVRSIFGVVLDPLSDGLGWPRETFALSLAIQNLVWGLGQPFFGMIADRMGDRRALWLGFGIYLGRDAAVGRRHLADGAAHGRGRDGRPRHLGNRLRAGARGGRPRGAGGEAEPGAGPDRGAGRGRSAGDAAGRLGPRVRVRLADRGAGVRADAAADRGLHPDAESRAAGRCRAGAGDPDGGAPARGRWRIRRSSC